MDTSAATDSKKVAEGPENEVFRIQGTQHVLVLNISQKRVFVDDERVHLTGKEYQMLEILALQKGKTVTKGMFLNRLYGNESEPEQKIIDVFACKLRKKLVAAANGERFIYTVWGRGYALRDFEQSPVPIRQAASLAGAGTRNVRYVIGPDGSPLVVSDLPPSNTVRWVIRRKAELVAAVRGGLVTLEDVCGFYNLAAEEFFDWQLHIDRHGVAGLRATRVQQYRH